ncbi:hypothetical protein Q5M85_20175 [Paraclostridium bifermentans]|nr:hypothetical protein [Paraclostridium bifermentans]
MEAKNREVKSNFEDMPVAIAGIALGFMSISTALLEFNVTWVRHLAVVFSIICIGFLLIKLILHPNKVMNEIKTSNGWEYLPNYIYDTYVSSSVLS